MEKCKDCIFYGKPCDAPATVEDMCMWYPSDDNGYALPCEDAAENKNLGERKCF